MIYTEAVHCPHCKQVIAMNLKNAQFPQVNWMQCHWCGRGPSIELWEQENPQFRREKNSMTKEQARAEVEAALHNAHIETPLDEYVVDDPIKIGMVLVHLEHRLGFRIPVSAHTEWKTGPDILTYVIRMVTE